MKPIARIALLSSGPPLSLKALYCLRALRVPIDLIDLGATTSIARYSRYKSRYLKIHTAACRIDPKEMEAKLINYVAQQRFTGIVPADIAAAGFLHSIRNRLPGVVVFPVSSMETLELLDDKWQFAELLRTHCIPGPATALLSTSTSLNDVEHWPLAFPLLLKPLRGESGHGISLFDNRDQLRNYLRNARSTIKLPMIVQEYACGIDADISILAHQGVVHAHILQLRHTPGIIEFASNNQALVLAKEIAKVTNYSGVANIDLRIDPQSGEVKVIECNPRFWYTLQASLWRGLNFATAGLDLAQGRNVAGFSPDSGRYYYHGHIVRKMLLNPSKWRSIPRYNWHGFWQATSDPLPFLSAEIRHLHAGIDRFIH